MWRTWKLHTKKLGGEPLIFLLSGNSSNHFSTLQNYALLFHFHLNNKQAVEQKGLGQGCSFSEDFPSIQGGGEVGVGGSYSFFSRPALPAASWKDRPELGRRLFHINGQYLWTAREGGWCMAVKGWGEMGEVTFSLVQSHNEVCRHEGVATLVRGGARSGSVPRLISRCHSATVGSRREGQPKKHTRTGIGWLCWRERERERASEKRY